MRVISYILIFFRIHIIPKHMKLSIYADALELVQNDKSYDGLCVYLFHAMNSHEYYKLSWSFGFKFWYFPEVYIQKPLFIKRYDGQSEEYWWDFYDKKIRIKALEKAISLIK